ERSLNTSNFNFASGQHSVNTWKQKEALYGVRNQPHNTGSTTPSADQVFTSPLLSPPGIRSPVLRNRRSVSNFIWTARTRNKSSPRWRSRRTRSKLLSAFL